MRQVSDSRQVLIVTAAQGSCQPANTALSPHFPPLGAFHRETSPAVLQWQARLVPSHRRCVSMPLTPKHLAACQTEKCPGTQDIVYRYHGYAFLARENLSCCWLQLLLMFVCLFYLHGLHTQQSAGEEGFGTTAKYWP